MNLNKKVLISSLAVILTMSMYGCSNENKENTNTTVVTDASSKEAKVNVSDKDMNNSNKNIDEDIKKFYDYIITQYKQNPEMATKAGKEQIEKIEKNIPILMELNQKAKNTCSKDYNIEGTINNSKEKNIKHIENIKVSNGSSREEEYKNGKLAYLSIYSKNEDTHYVYDVAVDKLQKSTKYSKKNNGQYPNKNGFFSIIGNNVLGANLKYTDYNGKKALYAEFISEGVDANNKVNKSVSKAWYDAETGIVIKESQEVYENKALSSTYSVDYTIKFDKTFDKETFTFDKTKLNK